MARGKKQETLTPEARLQAALVPHSQQPYQVPQNWCWVRLQTLCEIPITDGTHKTPKYSDKENGVPFISAKDVTKGYIDWSNIKYITQELHEELYQHIAPQVDDILLAKNGTTGVAALVVDNYIFDLYVTLAILRPNKKLIIPRYLYFLVNSPVSKKQFNDHLTGISVPNLHLRDIKATAIPFPPLPEQQRIVERIESLFAKLDAAKQKAQAALDSFEPRKAAILHKAFTGALTAQWRTEHGVGLESWETKPLSKITQNHDSKRIPLSRAERNKLARIYDYYGASGVIDKVDNFLFDGRTLLIGEDGANLVTRSKPIAFIADGKYWVNNHAHVLTAASEISLDFLCHYINSIDLTPYITGSAQPKMTQSKMNKIPITVPPFNEQREIVRILDALLTKEQQAKAAAEGVLEQIDLLKQAILARAFRGELGTNDPGEGPALGLLQASLR